MNKNRYGKMIWVKLSVFYKNYKNIEYCSVKRVDLFSTYLKPKILKVYYFILFIINIGVKCEKKNHINCKIVKKNKYDDIFD